METKRFFDEIVNRHLKLSDVLTKDLALLLREESENLIMIAWGEPMTIRNAIESIISELEEQMDEALAGDDW